MRGGRWSTVDFLWFSYGFSSNNYYLFLNGISFLFFHFLLQGDPCIFLLLLLFLITSAFSKMQYKMGDSYFLFFPVQ